MKKIKFFLLSLALIAGVCTANAQDKQHAVGFNLGYAVGSNGISNFGIGVKYDYSFSENLRVEPSFMYYFDNSKIGSMMDPSINFHYLFDIGSEKVHLFPIFGFTTLFGKQKDVLNDKGELENDHFFRFGCNLGMGFQYDITDDFGLVLEGKYKLVKDFGQANIALGCVVTF